MAPRMGVAVVVIVALVLVNAGACTAQQNCTSAYTSLIPCLTYVTGTGAAPDTACCTGVAFVNTNNPDCLCQTIQQLNSSSAVNLTKAYALPRDCNVPVNTTACPAFALAPAGAPAGAPAAPPVGAPAPSPGAPLPTPIAPTPAGVPGAPGAPGGAPGAPGGGAEEGAPGAPGGAPGTPGEGGAPGTPGEGGAPGAPGTPGGPLSAAPATRASGMTLWMVVCGAAFTGAQVLLGML